MFNSTNMYQKLHSMLEEVNLKTKKGTKTPNLTRLADIQHETHEENPVTGRHESTLYF